MNFGTFLNFGTSKKKISELWKKKFKDFFDKNIFPDNIFFKEFFISFKTITLYKRDMYVFA